MRILGVDPGSRHCGWAVLEKGNGRCKILLIAYGVIKLDASQDVVKRLPNLALQIQKIVRDYRPQIACVEDIFLSKNARAALILGQARGAILGVLGLEEVAIETLGAKRVKQILCGNGNSTKDQVAQMVVRLFDLVSRPKEDAADAIAIAYSAIALMSMPTKMIKPKEALRRKNVVGRKALLQIAQRQGKV